MQAKFAKKVNFFWAQPSVATPPSPFLPCKNGGRAFRRSAVRSIPAVRLTARLQSLAHPRGRIAEAIDVCACAHVRIYYGQSKNKIHCPVRKNHVGQGELQETAGNHPPHRPRDGNRRPHLARYYQSMMDIDFECAHGGALKSKIRNEVSDAHKNSRMVFLCASSSSACTICLAKGCRSSPR